MENVSAGSGEAAECCRDTMAETAQSNDVIFGDLAVLRIVFSPMVSVGCCPLPAKLANATTSEQRFFSGQDETGTVN